MKNNKKKTMKKVQSSSFDLQKVSSIVANFCQLGLLVLAVFGYFYTVRPVYQNQKLNEENAKLLTENEKIKNDTIVLQQQIQPLSEKIQILQQKNTSLENQYSLTYHKLINLQQEKKLREQEERIIKDKEQIIASINEFKNELCMLIGETRGQKDFKVISSGLSKKTDVDIYYSRLNNTDEFISDYFYNPFSYINTGILKFRNTIRNYPLEKQNRYFSYCDRLAEIIDKRKKDHFFNEEIISNIRNLLIDYNNNRLDIENSIEKESDIIKKIRIRGNLLTLKEKTLNEIHSLSKGLIDYPDILNPAIDEMVNYYIDEYMMEIGNK